MQPSIHNKQETESFWTNRYEKKATGWDIGYPSTPIKTYIDQLASKDLKILIPGAGNAYEAEYLFANGFEQVYVMDVALQPLKDFQERNPSFPSNQLLHENFFHHQGQYDLIVEQTFFCSFPPTAENRMAYAEHMWNLLKAGGKLVGLWFSFPLRPNQDRPPYGGLRSEYFQYFEPKFVIKTFEPAYNSIKPRMENELFGIFVKK